MAPAKTIPSAERFKGLLPSPRKHDEKQRIDLWYSDLKWQLPHEERHSLGIKNLCDLGENNWGYPSEIYDVVSHPSKADIIRSEIRKNKLLIEAKCSEILSWLSTQSQKGSVETWLLRERHSFSEQAKGKKTVFRGKVDRVDGNVAYVTLTDERGRETFADCSLADLEAHGIGDDSRFECVIQERGLETVVTLKPVEDRQLSRSEWKEFSKQVEEALADYNLADDY